MKTLDNQEAFKAIFEQRIDCLTSSDGLTAEAMFEGISQAQLIMDIVKIVGEIGGTTDALFSIQDGKQPCINGWVYYKFMGMTTLGRKLVRILNSLDHSAFNFSEHNLDPRIEIFYKEAEKRFLPSYAREIADRDFRRLRFVHDKVETINDLFNDFVNEIRLVTKTPSFKKAIKNYKRSASENQRELLAYLEAHSELHSRMMVIRLDLSYKKTEPPKTLDALVLLLNEAKNHRSLLLKAMRASWFKDYLLGYVWKLEYGKEKLFHYHFLFLFDGSRIRKDVEIAKMIGDLWSRKITKGKGLYYNCNAKKSFYQKPGIGIIEHDSHEKIANLKNEVISYLTKPDEYIRLLLPNNSRTFGKGEMPKPRESSVGRPRRTDR